MSPELWFWVKTVLLLGPIAVLICGGAWLALRSGEQQAVAPAAGLTPRAEALIGTASRIAFYLAGCGVAFAAAQRMVGLRIALPW